MKLFTFCFALFAVTANFTFVQGDDGVCKKCEVIREYNKTHHKNYEYYDDYLKDNENNENDLEDQEESEPKETPKTTKISNPKK